MLHGQIDVISIHAPAKGATCDILSCVSHHSRFQSTLPRRERHRTVTVYSNTGEFQSTLPRWERPEYRAPVTNRDRYISIHAPAKGATSTDGLQCADRSISIHAPAKGATRNLTPTRWAQPHFNPRSREGSDLVAAAVKQQAPEFQSTLPRRERLAVFIVDCTGSNFNPRSREGSDRSGTMQRPP